MFTVQTNETQRQRFNLTQDLLQGFQALSIGSKAIVHDARSSLGDTL